MIVGAGLAGLIAAHIFPRMPLAEASPEPRQSHRALLRFRSTAVAEVVGIEFRPVVVRKGIWADGGWCAPSIREANRYSQKVIGRLIDRSIWNIEPSTRYVAPEDLYDRMIESVGSRVSWGLSFDFGTSPEPVISTAPMDVATRALGIDPGVTFSRASITVRRYRVPRSDVFQTVYYPTDQHTLYRASITGDLLICEFAGEPAGAWEGDLEESFWLPPETTPVEGTNQAYGKIAPINEEVRKSLISKLTRDHAVFSLGRFATWRNILLDDVVHDAFVVKRLMTSTEYERRLYEAVRTI